MNQDGGVIGFRKKPKTQKKCVGNHCAVQLKKFSNFCFKNFVDHCTVRFIGSGTYGKAFLLTITDPILSPYVDIEGNPVKVILVKIGVVQVNNMSPLQSANGVDIMEIHEFKTEVHTQEKIFRSSLEHFNSALCPAIIYIDVLAPNEFHTLYPKLQDHVKKETGLYYSLIGMETFEHVDNVFKHGMTDTLKDTIFYLLIRLGAIGFAHGDPSEGNVIIDKTTERPFLIDFGNVQRLNPEETEFMQRQLQHITDKERLLHILLKGFPHSHPKMTNWDWLKYIQTVHKPQPGYLKTLEDTNWRNIL